MWPDSCFHFYNHGLCGHASLFPGTSVSGACHTQLAHSRGPEGFTPMQLYLDCSSAVPWLSLTTVPPLSSAVPHLSQLPFLTSVWYFLNRWSPDFYLLLPGRLYPHTPTSTLIFNLCAKSPIDFILTPPAKTCWPLEGHIPHKVLQLRIFAQGHLFPHKPSQGECQGLLASFPPQWPPGYSLASTVVSALLFAPQPIPGRVEYSVSLLGTCPVCSLLPAPQD